MRSAKHLWLPLALPLLLLCAALPAARAQVVRPAPGFVAGGKPLAAWRGQPVVLLIAPSPHSRAFRQQARKLEALYQSLAARGVLFAAAFTGGEPGQIPGNIPFTPVTDAPRVAAAYAALGGYNGRFGLNVIGRDGNLDLASPRVEPAVRVRDMVLNNAAQQTLQRKGR